MSLSPLNVPIEIIVKEDTWPNADDPTRVCPTEIKALTTLGRATSVDSVLLWTAYCTRPPESDGFSLADLWAWLRYRPALSDGPDLRLRPAWNRIDTHQKTILSDDLGMGFAVELLATSLGFQDVADTVHVVKVTNPDDYALGRTGKRGPSKSPDFLLTNVDGDVSVLECKGTQASREQLASALKDGEVQKGNISRTGGALFAHSLVAGLFIPQATKGELALIQIHDPEPKDLMEILANTQLTTLQLGILQISLAKQLSLLGLHSWANVLSTTPTRELDQVQFPRDLDAPVQLVEGSPHMTQIYYPPSLSAARVPGPTSIIFEMLLLEKIYILLRESPSVSVALAQLSQFRGQRTWGFSQNGSRSRLESPLGFTLSLEYR